MKIIVLVAFSRFFWICLFLIFSTWFCWKQHFFGEFQWNYLCNPWPETSGKFIVERLPSSQGLEDRPIATPTRATISLPQQAAPPLPAAPPATGQLSLHQLGACEFKPYPNQPKLPQKLPFKDSMRQLTWWDLPTFINGPKVGSPSSTVATTVLESHSDLGSSLQEACQRFVKTSMLPNRHMHFSFQTEIFQSSTQSFKVWTSCFNTGL